MITPRRSLRVLTIAAGVSVSAVIVWLIVREIDLNRVRAVIGTAHDGWLLIGLAAITATLFTRTQRWAVLLRPIVLRASTLARALLVGQVLNFVLPIRLGDVIRSAWLGRAPHASFERVLGSVAIEKAWDWLTLTLLVIVTAWVTPVPDWLILPLRSVGVVAVAVLIGFGVAASLPRDRWQPWVDRVAGRTPIAPRLNRLLDSISALRDRSTLSAAAGWSLITWALGVVANYAVLRAYGVELWSAALLLMVVLMIGVTLPPSIAAIGLYEGLTLVTLGVFNVPPATALAIGLTLHLIVFGPPLIGAGVLLLVDR